MAACGAVKGVLLKRVNLFKMANLSHLRIHNSPKAFAEFAERHNELVGLIESLQGALGVDIQIAHSPKQKVKMPPGVANPKARPRGKILVSVVPTALDGSVNGGASSTGTNYGPNIAALEALTAGLYRTNVSYCTGNTASTVTVLMS
jgi:hypothetical protein